MFLTLLVCDVLKGDKELMNDKRGNLKKLSTFLVSCAKLKTVFIPFLSAETNLFFGYYVKLFCL